MAALAIRACLRTTLTAALRAPDELARTTPRLARMPFTTHEAGLPFLFVTVELYRVIRVSPFLKDFPLLRWQSLQKWQGCPHA